VTCTAQVDDPFACERAIHTLLAARRVSHGFFELTALEARTLFSLLAPQAEQGEQSEENEQAEQRRRAWTPESSLRAWGRGAVHARARGGLRNEARGALHGVRVRSAH
jgi:hypothetical protein